MRQAIPADIDRLVALMTGFYLEAGFTLNLQRARSAFSRLLGNESLGCVWMIEQGSADVGYVALTLVFCLEYGGICGFVDDLYIEPRARGFGLARAAIAELRRHAESHGLRSLRVETASDNAPAVATYRGAGLRETGRQLLALELATPTHAG
ncbi:MAG: GNAT family N-acetyltransferase [Gemmatimonadota bacterium]